MKHGEVHTPEDVIELFVQYNRGRHTQGEIVCTLIEAAARCAPCDLAVHIPTDWLARLQEETLAPPNRIEDVHYISGVLGGEGFDYESYFKRKEQIWFDGAWNWHRYFAI